MVGRICEMKEQGTNGNGSGALVLVLCTGNSCRSQMAEAILRDVVDGKVEVASAGSKPSGYVHEMAREKRNRC